jgi:hypothetical protein
VKILIGIFSYLRFLNIKLYQMISLNQIVSNNLEMLKSQEAELLQSLKFVQKAKQLFQAHWGTETSTAKRRGRPSSKKNTPKVSAAPKSKLRKTSKDGAKRVSHLTNILEILKQNGKPMSSAELISVLFKKQNADKNLNHFRLLIYPVLTKAYQSKTLIRKGGKISIKK